MLYLVIKAALSGLLIGIVSEIAKRNPAIGAVVLSLPLISLVSFIWVWKDTGDELRIASLAESTFWFILPTLPMFLILPALIRHGVGFWTTLAVCCALTVGLYLLTAWAAGKLGINI